MGLTPATVGGFLGREGEKTSVKRSRQGRQNTAGLSPQRTGLGCWEAGGLGIPVIRTESKYTKGDLCVGKPLVLLPA